VTRNPAILAVGAMDAGGVAGTSGVRGEWAALGIEAPGDARTFRALFRRTDRALRRLDRASRALVVAAEAAGLGALLPRDARDETALVVETARGSLESDLRFARSLAPGPPHGAVFPFTLPSASLGEVAIRHRLRGPAVCLSVDAESAGEALREAARLLEDGDARFAVAGCVEVGEPRVGLPGALRAVVALVAPSRADLAAVLPWRCGPQAFDELAAFAARGERAGSGAP
jgi:3-oxoacyl-(acyl-carrier-protein) synthase